MSAERCEACGSWRADHVVDFGDGQVPFTVCGMCAAIVDGGVRVRVSVLVR